MILAQVSVAFGRGFAVRWCALDSLCLAPDLEHGKLAVAVAERGKSFCLAEGDVSESGAKVKFVRDLGWHRPWHAVCIRVRIKAISIAFGEETSLSDELENTVETMM